MRTYFTADTHFGHQRIIEYCKRPYSSVEAMDQALIAKWNAVVRPEDDVWHLGDFAFGGKEAALHVLGRLNGKIHLVWGNHDPEEVRTLPNWASSQPFAEIVVHSRKLVLCHYALRVWNGSHKGEKGAWHLYGHSHGTLSDMPWSCDVGVDVAEWGGSPIGITEISRLFNSRQKGVEP